MYRQGNRHVHLHQVHHAGTGKWSTVGSRLSVRPSRTADRTAGSQKRELLHVAMVHGASMQPQMTLSPWGEHAARRVGGLRSLMYAVEGL